MIKLSDTEFAALSGFVKDNYGINLTQKRQLIESRLNSLLLEKEMTNFTDYIRLIKEKNSAEIHVLLNRLTTNHTYFLREEAHFTFLRDAALPQMKTDNPDRALRIWSAGCSSGEEAYTAVMVIKEFLGPQSTRWDTRLLATDISEKVMNRAREGVYPAEALQNIPPAWRLRYFESLGDGQVQLRREVRDEVIFRYFNLMDTFPYKKPFDIIFCRNVMIYFDQHTKNDLINKFYDALRPGGYLFIGHSETVQRDKSRLAYVQPSIYRKEV